MRTDRSAAFTLIELIAVFGVILLFVAIAVPAFGRYLDSGRQTREMSAARKLIAGYLSFAADNDGWLLAGYSGPEDPVGNPDSVRDAAGNAISFPANARYPWRLAAHIDYDFDAILFNGNENALRDKVDSHYAASVRPNLGINAVFVGGHYGSGSPLIPNAAATARFGSFCVTRLGQATYPSKLIVFASARQGKHEPGYYEIRPPNVISSQWSGSWNPEAPASAFGFLDLRWDRHAVAAMLDGHIELLDEDQLKDMRRWSNQAAEEDNPNFSLKRLPRS